MVSFNECQRGEKIKVAGQQIRLVYGSISAAALVEAPSFTDDMVLEGECLTIQHHEIDVGLAGPTLELSLQWSEHA